MTPNDKSPTSRASEGGTVLAALVQGNLHAARAFGFDADALERAAGLSAAALADPDGRVPFDRHLALWEAIDADPRGLAFGLWLGERLTLTALGVVGYVMQHAPDLGAALRCLERFNRLLGDDVGPEIAERGGQVLLRRVEPARVARVLSLSIAAPLGTVTLLRSLAGLRPDEPIALEAAFQHPPFPGETLTAIERALGCPLIFNAEEMRLVLPRALLDRPLSSPDEGLFAYLERHAQTLQGRLATTTALADRVRALLTARIREGEPTQASIAQALAMSERTLQRRLQADGVSFAQLLDEVRADLGRMYLADPTLAVFEVAFLLGYSEPSPFNRAFRRWTGQSPSDFRASLAAPSG